MRALRGLHLDSYLCSAGLKPLHGNGALVLFPIYFCQLSVPKLVSLTVLTECSKKNNFLSSTEVRSEEKVILERGGVVQSLTVGVAPIVVVIACVCTFTLHMALGYDLTAAEVFLYTVYIELFLHFL